MDRDALVRRRLKLRGLDTLLAVAQQGSMAKAAAYLSVSQPAVSKAIAELEHTLGVRLLDRTARGVEPNLYGRAILECAIAVFDHVRQGVKEIEFLADPTAGELRVAAPETINAGLLPAIMERLHRRYPRIAVQVKQASTVQLHRELRERNVELVLGPMETLVDEELHAEILFQDRQVVVAGLGHRWGRRRKIRLVELIDEPWTLPPPTQIAGSLIAEAFRAGGLDIPRNNVETTSIALHCALLASGRHLGILPSSMLRLSGKRLGLKVMPVDLAISPLLIGIATLKNRTISPLTQRFIEHAREVAKSVAIVR